MLGLYRHAPEGGVNDELVPSPSTARSCHSRGIRRTRPSERPPRRRRRSRRQPRRSPPFSARPGYDTSDASVLRGLVRLATPAPRTEPAARWPTMIPGAIISGAEDMRTPTRNAAAVAHEIPTRRCSSPEHRPLGARTEPTNCARTRSSSCPRRRSQQCQPRRRYPTRSCRRRCRRARCQAEAGLRNTRPSGARPCGRCWTRSRSRSRVGVAHFLNGSRPRQPSLRWPARRWAAFSLSGLHLHGYSYLPGSRSGGRFTRRSEDLHAQDRQAGKQRTAI